MDGKLESYLNEVDKYLRPIPTSERVDIIQEIKSQILEMEKVEGKSPDEIIQRLGTAKDMANAYLGDILSKSKKFQYNKILTLIAFYSVTGFTGAIVIPFLGLLAPVFKFCSVLTPVSGIVKFIVYLFGYDLPIVKLQLGSMELPPYLVIPVTILFGIGFYKLSNYLWKLLLRYIHSITKKKNDLYTRVN